jgi:hypothetical protein
MNVSPRHTVTMRKGKAERNAASIGASIGASLGSRGGPVSAGIGAGFGGALGYLAGACSPCGRKAILPDGGRVPGEREASTERGVVISVTEES